MEEPNSIPTKKIIFRCSKKYPSIESQGRKIIKVGTENLL